MEHVFIVTGGTIEDDWAKEKIETEKPDVCIAVDSGMEFFRRAKLLPDIIVGDFDSVEEDTMAYFQSCQKIKWKTLNPKKDDTDTECAVRMAVFSGAKSITLLGATGTRIDHMLGNIELLGIGLEHGVPMQIVDAKNKIRMIRRGITIQKRNQYGNYVSLLPYTSEVTGLTLKGFLYPLDRYTLTGFCSIGISNEIAEEKAEISFENGILLVIEAKD